VLSAVIMWMQADGGEGGEYYMDNECTEFDNLDYIANDDLDEVIDEDQYAQSAAIGQYQQLILLSHLSTNLHVMSY